MVRVRVGRLLLRGAGLGLVGTGAYTFHNAGYEVNNVGVVRFGRAALAVGRIGIDYTKSLYYTSYPTDEEREVAKGSCHQRSADKLLDLCCANGGVFIKVGQHIGALDYLLPDEYVNTMKVLHHEAPKMPLEDIYDVISKELGEDAKTIFATFDEEPLGSASLAQVHHATLHDGTEVAVKVQHKFVKKHSFVDIVTMDFLVRAVKFAFPDFEFMWLADEMKKNLPLELSFIQESKNSEKVAKLLKDYDWLRIPKIEWNYTTERLLVMEYCSGAHINDVESLKAEGVDCYDVSLKISKMYCKMIMEEGYVHCDPHPGNIKVRKDDNGKVEIVLLDHGLYTQLSNQFRYDYSEFWQAIINRDIDEIKRTADQLGVGDLYGLFACMVTARSWNSIQKGLEVSARDKSESAEIKENAARYMKEITDILAFVNRQMILIFKTNDLLRNIESSLGTSNSMISFLQMSRSCIRTLQEKNLKGVTSKWTSMCIQLRTQWNLFKISMYQFYLTVYWSRFGALLKLR